MLKIKIFANSCKPATRIIVELRKYHQKKKKKGKERLLFVLISVTFENFISLHRGGATASLRFGLILIAIVVVVSTDTETIIERTFQVTVIAVFQFPWVSYSYPFSLPPSLYLSLSLSLSFLHFLSLFVILACGKLGAMKSSHFQATIRPVNLKAATAGYLQPDRTFAHPCRVSVE